MKEIYLDNAATTKVREEVVEEMNKYFSLIYGNPGSFHGKGLEAKDALEEARERVARILNCNSKEIVFTGGGTESINLALKGLAKSLKGEKNHIITSKVEHHAVLHTCEYLEKYENCEVTYLDVDEYGIVNPEDVKNAIKENTFLVTIMYANNEIGSINPIMEIGKVVKENNIYFHTDACQAAGYLDLDVEKLNVDLMTINASKLYGPKGVGLLYVKRGISLVPLIHGGGQENKLRSGTENVPGIMGLVKALELAQEDKALEVFRLIKLRDKLIDGLLKIPKTFLNGHPEQRLPNNVNITFLDIEGEAMILYLNEFGIHCSTGSACTSQTLDPSHVVIATNLPYEAAHGSVRFSLGKETTEEDVDKVLEVMPDIVSKLRAISPINVNIEHVLEVRGGRK
ncbi:aminotransferase class V-fold PLP-dependent enzyme [Candidatus Woesearchaeota archaeon]|nr:aminotransferase class V-fold PLP-dependent enzyme [Candidatus Woesearchaeota archaeon]